MEWQPLDDPAENEPPSQKGPTVQADPADRAEGENDEEAALAALCGPLGLSLVLEKGSPSEIMDWIARAAAQGLSDADVAPARRRLAELTTEAKLPKVRAPGSTTSQAAPKPMDADWQRLSEQAWELRASGDRCREAHDMAQAVRYYEWALDLLKPLPVEHAGPTRCALLLSLARCHLQNSRDFRADAARALQCCKLAKAQDPHGAWQAETSKLQGQAEALLPELSSSSGGQAATTPAQSAPASASTRSTAAAVRSRTTPTSGKSVYCLELNSVQTFNMLDTVLTDDIFFAMDAIKQDRMRRSG